MKSLGDILFSASPFVRWALSPFLILAMVVLPLCNSAWTPQAVVIVLGLELISLSLLLGFWTTGKFQSYCFRFVTAVVFISYCSYFIHEFFFTNHPFILNQHRSESSPRNALLGLIVIGLPSLWFTLWGRFTLHPKTDILEDDADGGEGRR